MGGYVSHFRRRSASGEEVDSANSQFAYQYPPKNGCNFFASHFIMGGERFETCQPEMYLFGENLDLNFLGGKPTPFPYAAPLPNEPVRTLHSLINIRKESLRFVRITNPVEEGTTSELAKGNEATDCDTAPLKSSSSDHHVSSSSSSMCKATSLLRRHSSIASSKNSHNSNSLPCSVSLHKDSGKHGSSTCQGNNHKETLETPDAIAPPEYHYNIEFTFDCDVAIQIVIAYFCTEEVTQTGVYYTPKEPSMSSEKVVFKRGSGQVFSQPLHIFTPSKFNELDLIYRVYDENGFFDHKIPFPVVIQAVALEGDEPRQSHSLIAVVEKNQNGSYTLKPFIQKMFIDGLCYLIQEIYGIENKTVPTVKLADQYTSPEDDLEDSASECVVCLSDPRDTLILPCRHLCLCNACADSLRYQANNCPICRSPFRALLQIRAVRKVQPMLQPPPSHAISITSSNAPIPVPRNTSNAIQSTLCTASLPSDVVDVPQGYQSLPLMEALHGASISPYPAVYSIDKTPVSVRKNHRRDKARGIMVNPVPIVPNVSLSPSAPPLEMTSFARRAISSTASDAVAGRTIPHPTHINLNSVSSMPVQRTSSLNSFPEKYSLTPPQPAPADWKVPVARICRKGSDPEDPESSSSASSSTVPQETTRLLPRAADAVQPPDAIASSVLMGRPSELSHQLMERKESYTSVASTVDLHAPSPKLIERELTSLSSSSSFPIIAPEQPFTPAANAILSNVVINNSDMVLNTSDFDDAINSHQGNDEYQDALDACDLQLNLVKLTESQTAENLEIATIDD